MKSKVKDIASRLLVFLLIFSFVVPSGVSLQTSEVYAAPKATAFIGTASAEPNLDMWHYSGKYWQVGNKDSEKQTWTDAQMGEVVRGMTNLYGGKKMTLEFSLKSDLAQELRNLKAAGESWRVEVKARASGGEMPYFDEGSTLYDTEDASQYLTLSDDCSTAYLVVTPNFNLHADGVETVEISDIGTNISTSTAIPMIDIKYGWNMFSVYGNGVSAVQVNGYFEYANPMAFTSGRIHPSMIANNTGALKSGYRIFIHGVEKDSAGYSIGSGTFASAGACGISFRYPITLTFYKNATYRVKFDLNGHGSPQPADQMVKAGDTAKEPNAPTADGYIFKGWTDKDGKPWDFPGDLIVEDTTIYAEWEEIVAPDPGVEMHIVTFDARGYAPNPPQQAVEHGGNAREPVLGEPTGKDNKVPDGNWYRSPSDADNKIAPWVFPEDTVESDITLYAGTEDIVIIDGDVEADIQLPNVTYVGHTVYAEDHSTYHYDGVAYNAQRAIAEGIGKNKFNVTPKNNVTSSHAGRTSERLVFKQKGTYSVTLTASIPALSKSSSATKGILVLETPHIDVIIGGIQKENRKQTFQAIVAQDPNCPVNYIQIEIKDPVSGEKITVNRNFSGAQPGPVNASHIKYRTLFDIGSDEEFVRSEIDFLTKWHEDKDLEYTVTAKDQNGVTKTATGTFHVVKDKEPEAAIDIDEAYYRDENSKTGKIVVSDATKTDGDAVQRTWSYRFIGAKANTPGAWKACSSMSGYLDRSFGSLKTIQFNQTGVGWFDVKLVAKDVWVEETLPEYITAADYRSAEATAQSKMDNVAPVVSIELQKSETANVLLIAKNEASAKDIESKKAQLQAQLRSEGLNANVFVDYVRNEGVTATGQTHDVFGHDGSVGRTVFYQNEPEDSLAPQNVGIFAIGGNVVADDDCWYALTGTYAMYTTGNYAAPNYPYYLTKYSYQDTNMSNPQWVATITTSVFNGTNYLENAKIVQDAQNKYIYLTGEGRTAIFDKKTGAFLANIQGELGNDNIVGETSIYTFKPDGIYRLPLSGGAMTQVYAGSVEGFAKVGGEYLFLTKISDISTYGFYIGKFNANTEEVKLTYLSGSNSNNIALIGRLVGMDEYGNTVINVMDGDSSTIFIYAYRADGSLIKSFSFDQIRISSESAIVYPVWDGNRKIQYIGAFQDWKAGKATSSQPDKYYAATQIIGIYDDKSYYASTEIQDRYYGYDPAFAVFMNDGIIRTRFGSQYADKDNVRFSFNTATDQEVSTSVPGWPRSRSGRYFGRAYIQHSGPYIYSAILSGSQERDMASIYTLQTISEAATLEIERLTQKHVDYSADYTYVKTNATSDDFAQIVTAMAAEKENGAKSLVLQPSGASGSISKNATLIPGAKYYYEYDTNASGDILSGTATMQNMVNATEGYVVENTYKEDFEKAPGNSFFTLSGAMDIGKTVFGSTGSRGVSAKEQKGLYILVSHVRRKDDYYHGGSSTTKSVTFTVPEGKAAALEFDYMFYDDIPFVGLKNCYISIAKDGGEAVPIALNTIDQQGNTYSFNGTYHHPFMLTPGTYTLSASATYGRGKAAANIKVAIDNLIVRVMSSGAASHAASQPLNMTSSVTAGAPYNHVSGTFTAPQEVAYYGKYNGVTVYSGLNSAITAYEQTTSGNSVAHQITFTIPSGKKLLLSTYEFKSKWGSHSGSSRTSYYPANLDYYPGATGTTGSKMLASTTKSDSDGIDIYSASYNTPNTRVEIDSKVYVRNQTGTFRLLTNKINGYYGATLTPGTLKSYVVNASGLPASIVENKYFLSGDALYAEDVAFKGSSNIKLTVSGDSVVKNFRIYTIIDGMKVYVDDLLFNKPADLTGWTKNGVTADIRGTAVKKEIPLRVFKKGDFVDYQVFYSDWENDPSKSSYWMYTVHEPVKDSKWSELNKTMTSPVHQFYLDGKYTVKHWEWDNTGVTEFDKKSNECEITFYIEPGEASHNMGIDSIWPTPAEPEPGDSTKVSTKVYDSNGDPLKVVIEVYYKGGAHPVITKTVTGLTPNSSGVYPTVTTDSFTAQKGYYDAVVTVTCPNGAAIDTIRFDCERKIDLSAWTEHTTTWEANRKAYNKATFGNEYASHVSTFSTYKNQDVSKRIRGKNVYFPGERFVLNAYVFGQVASANSVKATCLEYPTWTAILHATGTKLPEGDVLYKGELWNSAMESTLNKAITSAGDKPIQITIRYSATFANGKTLTVDTPVIIDRSSTGYYRPKQDY